MRIRERTPSGWDSTSLEGFDKGENFEIGRKPISNPKFEIGHAQAWSYQSRRRAVVGVQFEISDFGFEMGFRPISEFLTSGPHPIRS